MDKNTKIIIGVVLAILTALGVWFIYNNSKNVDGSPINNTSNVQSASTNTPNAPEVVQSNIDLNSNVKPKPKTDHKDVFPTDIEGKYLSGSKSGYYQELTVKKLSTGNYNIDIVSGGSTSGCKFHTSAPYSRAPIVIPLKTVESKLASSLALVFQNDFAFIGTLKESDKNDLKTFCSNGNTLYGMYTKQK